MKFLKLILPHWSISVALIAVLKASSSIITTTNKSVMTVQAATTTQVKAIKLNNGALVPEIVKVDVIDTNGNKITFSAVKGSTLAEAIQKAGVSIPMSDELPMPLTTVLENDMSVVLTTTNQTVKKETVRFETVKKEDDSLAKGKTKVAQEGKNGKKELTYATVVANNVVQSTKKVSEKMVQEPIDKIILIGTKVAAPKVKAAEKTTVEAVTPEAATEKTAEATPAEESAEAVKEETQEEPATSGGRTMQVEATAYTGGGITATGIHLNDNSKVIAVDPSVIPLGSRVLIDGYGEYIAGDTGGAINGNIIDVYVASHSAAISFGRRALTIHILN